MYTVAPLALLLLDKTKTDLYINDFRLVLAMNLSDKRTDINPMKYYRWEPSSYRSSSMFRLKIHMWQCVFRNEEIGDDAENSARSELSM